MASDTKKCPMCKEHKSVSEFYVKKTGRQAGQRMSYCKSCGSKATKTWEREVGGIRPMSEAKDSGVYLGVHIAEHVLSNYFDNITRMPFGHRGYDFICGKGFKIDVKSGCLVTSHGSLGWMFHIRRNTEADYFLCLAFDNLESLKPQHIWLIPGNEVNTKTGIWISQSQMHTAAKWKKFERSLDKVVECCHKM